VKRCGKSHLKCSIHGENAGILASLSGAFVYNRGAVHGLYALNVDLAGDVAVCAIPRARNCRTDRINGISVKILTMKFSVLPDCGKEAIHEAT